MSEKKPESDASPKAAVRQRALSDDHFEFRGGNAASPVQPETRNLQVFRSREARLRHAYAHRYPCLTPGIWESAAVVVDKVIAWQLQQRRGLAVRDGVLNAQHFDFRDAPAPSGVAGLMKAAPRA